MIVFTGANDGDLVYIAVRHKTNCSGVDDYSRWNLTYQNCLVGAGL